MSYTMEHIHNTSTFKEAVGGSGMSSEEAQSGSEENAFTGVVLKELAA